MFEKFLKLFICLLLVILTGMLVLNNNEGKETSVEPDDFSDNQLFIKVHHSHSVIESDVLATKTEKVAETSNFSEKEGNLDEGYIKNLPREERKAYYKKLVEQYDWHHGVALAIIREESQYGHKDWLYNPEKHNGCRGSYGPGQIACLNIGNYGLTWDNVYDPEANVRAMYLLWKEQGFYPWGVCHIQNGVRKVRCWL